MCQNHIYYWVRCGHEANVFESCGRQPSCGGSHVRPNIFSARDTICANCASAREDNLIPLPRRIHRIAAFDEQIQRDEAQWEGLGTGLELQRMINNRDHQIRQEEDTLQSVRPQDMTARQARRLRILYSRLQDETTHQEVVTADDAERLQNLRTAFSRIPSRYLRDLSEYGLLTYIQTLLQVTIDIQLQYPENKEVIQAVVGLQARQQQLQGNYNQHQNERVQGRANQANCAEIQRFSREGRVKAILTVLSQIPLASIHEKDCSICGDPFGHSFEDKQVENPVRMRCGHVYGEDCIKTWLTENSTCPICRKDYALELTGAGPGFKSFSEEDFQQDHTIAEEARDILDQMEALRLSEA